MKKFFYVAILLIIIILVGLTFNRNDNGKDEWKDILYNDLSIRHNVEGLSGLKSSSSKYYLLDITFDDIVDYDELYCIAKKANTFLYENIDGYSNLAGIKIKIMLPNKDSHVFIINFSRIDPIDGTLDHNWGLISEYYLDGINSYVDRTHISDVERNDCE